MATRTAKLRIELDGEKQYKQALSELNQGNKVLASEMKKLSAEFKGNEDSIQALNAKGDLLQRQLLQQKDKVQTLRDALANAAQQYGEADKRTQNWQIKLNEAEAAQIDLEHAIQENNEEIRQQTQAFEKETQTVGTLGDQVQDLAGKLGIRLPEGATKALNGMKGFSAGTVAAMGAAAAAVAAVVKVCKELHETTLKAAADADDILTQSMVTGLSTETLQQFSYAANLVDVSVDTMTGSMTKLTRAMADAASGNETAAQKFTDLGVSIYNADGTLRNAEDVFYDTIDALGEIGNQTERDAAAMELMGKSAQDLNPLILQGSEALREYGEEAEAVGYVLDESQIKKLAEVDDAYQRMQLQIEAAKKELALEFAPGSKAAMDAFSNAVKKASEFLEQSGLVRSLASIVESVAMIFESGMSLIDALPGWMNPIQQISSALQGVAYVLAAIADAVNLVQGLAIWNWGSGKATTALGLNYGSGQASNIQRLRMSNAGTLSQYDEFYGNNAGGTGSWRGGLTWVGEAGPELVALPRGSQIYSNQESRGMGDQIINITVNGIEQLDEIVRWYDSRRIVGRMA